MLSVHCILKSHFFIVAEVNIRADLAVFSLETPKFYKCADEFAFTKAFPRLWPSEESAELMCV
jgi:hypothetical protein